MIKTRAISKISRIRWKKKDSLALILILFLGSVFSLVGFLYNNFYSVFFSICLGLFIGGIILSLVSTFLAQMESNISGEGEIDIDTDIDVDVDVDAEIDIDAEVDYDVDVDTDIDTDMEVEIDTDVDTDMEAEIDTEAEFELSDITPAPIMLLLSASFLVYGISGIILYYIFEDPIRFIIFFATPGIVYLNWKGINNTWKKIAKSRYYTISSTKNLIGRKGEVILPVDYRGGIIKIPSSTPMRFERIHVKPLHPESEFEREEVVYICDVKNGFLLVDNDKKLIKRRG
jgi:hypothetical protein